MGKDMSKFDFSKLGITPAEYLKWCYGGDVGRPPGTPEFDQDKLLFVKQGKLLVPTDEVVVHNLNNVKVVFRNRHDSVPYVDVYYKEALVASAYTVKAAFAGARLKIPRKPSKVSKEILAIRGWKLVGDLLTPLTREHDWETWAGPVATAHESPDEADTAGSGLYCCKLKSSLVDQFITQYRPHAYGLIGLSGKVIEYERGYRAERAAMRLLCVILPVTDITLKALEERYQCEVKRSKVVKPSEIGF